MKRELLEKLKTFIGEEIIVKYDWIGIEKEASGILFFVNKEKVIINRPFTFSFFGRRNISFRKRNTRIKRIITAQGNIIY